MGNHEVWDGAGGVTVEDQDWIEAVLHECEGSPALALPEGLRQHGTATLVGI